MLTVKKSKAEKGHGKAIVSADVKSYADDPYFLKKAAEAAETIKKVGLPIKNN